MRIDRLDLHRFGHFTGRSIQLPAGSRDFHVVVGANEAGKSTVRAAILDLLFGIEKSSTYDFVHAKSELCIGAALSNGERRIEFSRVKKARPLVDALGAPLPDDALSPFLGGADRKFFRQMFGLDHERLVTGGQEILEGSDDVGRILFQTATGIGNLGTLREALEKEAGELWAPRKAAGRAYYAAAEELAIADEELKRTLVKAKDWMDARDRSATLEQELEAMRAKHRELEEERCRLERIRRVAPHLRVYAESEEELASLGTVALLPGDAAKRLVEVETRIATANALLAQAKERIAEIRTACDGITIDVDMIRRGDVIKALAERGQQTRFHERDIGKREVEVVAHWAAVQDALRQLGWVADDEATLREKLPPLPQRRALRGLLARHGALHKAVEAATDAERAKHRELDATEQELTRQSDADVSAELVSALDAARRLGDVNAATKRESAKLAKSRLELRAAETRLGAWRRPTAELLEIELPSLEVTRQLRRERERLEIELRSATEKRDELSQDAAEAELAVTQYRRSHRAVTGEDLVVARQARDAAWSKIRTGARTVSDAATDFEYLVSETDRMADERHDKAKEAADLETKIDHTEQLRLRQAEAEKRCADVAGNFTTTENAWKRLADSLGFPEMPIEGHEDWRGALAQIRLASEGVELAAADVSALEAASRSATEGLRRALRNSGQSVADDAALDVLVVFATSLVSDVVASKARREELTRQVASARLALSDLEEKLATARSALERWQDEWTTATAQAGLAGLNHGSVDGALSLFDEIEEKLKTIRDLRDSRIQTMRRDLEDFDREAQVLADTLAPELVSRPACDVSGELSARLLKAIDDQREAKRLEGELRRYEEQQGRATADMDAARSTLVPWMETADVADIAALRDAIVRSDKWRKFRDVTDAAKTSAESGGDGLALAALAEEVDKADLALVAPRLGELANEQQEIQERRVALSAKLAGARAEVDRIAGQDNAARAATARQEALAHMADAADRFVKVHVAARLLRWAVDRYRETKQGPLLARASEVFAGLTRGSFTRLAIDFDTDPPTLGGLRESGKAVAVPHMSDGTRDQLYLALRLAALELHVTGGHALPFVADDLFVNFDDDRAHCGLEALAELSQTTQVIFLTHHQHLLPTVDRVLGASVNIVYL